MTDFSGYLQSISEKIETIDAAEAIEHHKQGDFCFVDLRDGFELDEFGLIPGAEHCPRGSLEFRIPSSSSFHRPYFSSFKRFVFYCSHGQRSILATHSAQKMGLEQACHIEGGMISWVAAGGKVVKFTRENG